MEHGLKTIKGSFVFAFEIAQCDSTVTLTETVTANDRHLYRHLVPFDSKSLWDGIPWEK